MCAKVDAELRRVNLEERGMTDAEEGDVQIRMEEFVSTWKSCRPFIRLSIFERSMGPLISPTSAIRTLLVTFSSKELRA
jgi:hypothetical protein